MGGYRGVMGSPLHPGPSGWGAGAWPRSPRPAGLHIPTPARRFHPLRAPPSGVSLSPSPPGGPPRTFAPFCVCAHLRGGPEEVNPDRPPLLIRVLGTAQGPGGGDRRGAESGALSPPHPSSGGHLGAPPCPPTEQGKPSRSHLVHIFLVCSEMTPHCWGEKGRVSPRGPPSGLRFPITPVPVTPALPVPPGAPPDRPVPPPPATSRSPRAGSERGVPKAAPNWASPELRTVVSSVRSSSGPSVS